MKSPLIDRRDFLRGAGAAFFAALSPAAHAAVLDTDAVFATSFLDRSGNYGAAILSERGKILHAVTLPQRGHDIAFDRVSRRSVVFARQPGTFALVFDHSGRNEPLAIASVSGRHFFGHGAFSEDGALLYATENDFDAAAGMIGVYDVRDRFARIGEFPTHGVGPHEVLLCPDGKTLAVANGGIETHPDYGSAKLNIATMKPSLVFLDRRTGDLLEKHELSNDLHQLSIRHMDFDANGGLWFGCQYEGPGRDRPPLVGCARRGSDLAMLDMPEKTLSAFRNYIGSVAANPKAGTVAVSSPQGNLFAVIDVARKSVVETRDLTEVCGLAPDGNGFFATTGRGDLVVPGAGMRTDPAHVWDNHMLRIEKMFL